MDFDYKRVDLAACREAGVKPCLIIPRKPGETWYVPETPLELQSQPQWSIYTQNDAVLVPLLPYLLREEPELAMAYMLSLGLSCALRFPRPVAAIHLAVGTPVEIRAKPVQGKSLQYYVGFAIRMEA